MHRALIPWIGIAVCAAAHAQSGAPAAGGTIIYKHVDENGRVTYANSPIKGGVRVELEPITVIPSTPTGSLGQSASPPTAAPAALPVPVAPIPRESQPASPAAALAVPVARVVSSGYRAPNERIAVKAQPVEADDTPRPLAKRPVAALAPAVVAPAQASYAPASAPASDPAPAALDAPAKPLLMTASLSPEAAQRLSEQRRAETRKRLLEGEVQTEEQLLSQARQALAEERRHTQGIRALRATFAASSEAGVQTPTKEQREHIERHFERVRNLQDQIAMHETHLKDLKDQLAARK
ncbi:MAG: DUF4124 domain-containing protein [Betaproteobacteria bacterium]|nr:DUF4124 domain-containing protein [Betaproteobacteria bacterium]